MKNNNENSNNRKILQYGSYDPDKVKQAKHQVELEKTNKIVKKQQEIIQDLKTQLGEERKQIEEERKEMEKKSKRSTPPPQIQPSKKKSSLTKKVLKYSALGTGKLFIGLSPEIIAGGIILSAYVGKEMFSEKVMKSIGFDRKSDLTNYINTILVQASVLPEMHYKEIEKLEFKAKDLSTKSKQELESIISHYKEQHNSYKKLENWAGVKYSGIKNATQVGEKVLNTISKTLNKYLDAKKEKEELETKIANAKTKITQRETTIKNNKVKIIKYEEHKKAEKKKKKEGVGSKLYRGIKKLWKKGTEELATGMSKTVISEKDYNTLRTQNKKYKNLNVTAREMIKENLTKKQLQSTAMQTALKELTAEEFCQQDYHATLKTLARLKINAHNAMQLSKSEVEELNTKIDIYQKRIQNAKFLRDKNKVEQLEKDLNNYLSQYHGQIKKILENKKQNVLSSLKTINDYVNNNPDELAGSKVYDQLIKFDSEIKKGKYYSGMIALSKLKEKRKNLETIASKKQHQLITDKNYNRMRDYIGYGAFTAITTATLLSYVGVRILIKKAKSITKKTQNIFGGGKK